MKLLVLTLSLVGCITALVDYTLIIHTSNVNHAGTDDLHIYATLYGERHGRTMEVTSPRLNNPGNDYQRNKYDTYNFRDQDVGQVSCVKMYATSGNDGWYFDSVRVRSTRSGFNNVVLRPHSQDKALSGPGDRRTTVVHEMKMCVNQETYNVRIHTSNSHRHAGTDSLYVSMEIIGEHGIITSPKLDNPGVNDYRRNGYDNFVFADKNVGTIRCVKLMIARGSDAWLMDGVTVTTSPHSQSINLSPESLQWLAGPSDSRASMKSELVLCEEMCDVYLNGDFEITNDWELLSIDFELDHSSSSELTPLVAGRQQVDNRHGSELQTITFSASREIAETESFTHTAGVSVSIGTTFEVGVPGIASGEVSTELTVSYEFSYGYEKTETNTFTATFNCVGGIGKFVVCEALVHKSMIRVPYVQTWRYKDVPSCTVESKGVFEKVAATSLAMEVSESDDGVNFHKVSDEAVRVMLK